MEKENPEKHFFFFLFIFIDDNFLMTFSFFKTTIKQIFTIFSANTIHVDVNAQWNKILV